METQSCVVLPDEAGTVQVTSSCQSIDAVQDVVAAALNLPYNKVLVGEPGANWVPDCLCLWRILRSCIIATVNRETGTHFVN